MIENLTRSSCLSIIEGVHGEVYSGRTLYCSGIIPFSPDKDSDCQEKNSTSASTSSQHVDLPGNDIAQLSSTQLVQKTNNESCGISVDVPPVKSTSFTEAKETFENISLAKSKIFLEQPSVNTLVRRHSISLMNRTPPKNSLSAELLATQQIRPQLLKTRDDLKDLSDRVSEFSSCMSSQDNSTDDSDHGQQVKDGLKTLNDKKRYKKNKRKLKITPDKDSFLKKPRS